MNYTSAKRNLKELESLGCTILHEVDVHNMNQHDYFKQHFFFDRIIFNFPHSGNFRHEHNAWVIREHQNLVSGFLGNAKYLLNVGGEIHITHKTAHPFSNWNIRNLAENERLSFVEEVFFNEYSYPGYENKRAFLARKYTTALTNLRELKRLGCTILYEVDVHQMNEHPYLKLHNSFDRIIFNFPHCGIFRRETEYSVI
ncbi:hypothetical protein RYX36_007971, partial [Vicia faba]